jgi:segregation and condensation protein A
LGVGSDRSAGSPDSWEIDSNPLVAALEPQALGNEAEESQSTYTRKDDNDRFNIKLDIFEGPLELLLHLIREHRLDIYDIPIAFITEQYLKHIEMMKLLNINIASDYLVMASWLVYIKSRTLLPQQGGEEEIEEDAEALRLELQRQLLEYQKFKGISHLFREAEEVQAGIYPRGGNGDGIMSSPEELENPPSLEVTVFDLISAIQKMIEEAGEEGIHLVEVDELEVADRQTHVLDMLENAEPEGVEFKSLFEGNGPKRLLIVVTFLAILELVRLSLIIATQSAIYGEIQIHKAVKDDE